MLHDADYVHGDLREPSVSITTEGLKVVDFDWCGKVRLDTLSMSPSSLSLGGMVECVVGAGLRRTTTNTCSNF